MNAPVTNLPARTEKRSVLVEMATRYGMEPKAFSDTLCATVFPKDGTNEEFLAFLVVAREYDLNPLTKEIYAFPKKGGGIQPIVSVDGWANILNSHPQLDGIEFDDHITGNQLTAITCRIWRKDRAKPIVCTEYMEECKRGIDTWKQWPRRMLRHKALIQCARYAFGFAGIVDPDEAERIGVVSPMRDVTPEDDGPPAPSLPTSRRGDADDLELVESGRSPPGEEVWDDPPPPEVVPDARAKIKAGLIAEIARCSTADLDKLANGRDYYDQKQKLSQDDQNAVDLAWMRRRQELTTARR